MTDVYTLANIISQRVKPGHWFRVSRGVLKSCGWNFMLYEHPAEHVMENIVGAAYEFTYFEHYESGDTIFERRKEPLPAGNLRTYVSPDRRHLYNRRPDRLWEYRGFEETPAEEALRKSRQRLPVF